MLCKNLLYYVNLWEKSILTCTLKFLSRDSDIEILIDKKIDLKHELDLSHLRRTKKVYILI